MGWLHSKMPYMTETGARSGTIGASRITIDGNRKHQGMMERTFHLQLYMKFDNKPTMSMRASESKSKLYLSAEAHSHGPVFV
jgi:hypothetical protein